MTNKLYFGDNLHVLRDQIADESVDLVYLDPPFNSNANYNILFKSPEGANSDAQIEAFEDTWHWNEGAEQAFDDVMRSGNTAAFELLRSMRAFLGDNDMMAYLAMMAVRLLELHRVLKPTGSLYLHCDPTASHYLKLLLDGVFGGKRFRNEIIWCYTGPGSPGMRQFMRKHDVIFWYNRGERWTFNADAVRIPHSAKTKENYKPGLEGSGFVGADHVIHEKGKVPEDYWSYAIAPRGKEYLGYPTQKPIKLLERIIAASSNDGDVVLDPFCGCGTAVHAAQKLGRQWIGIDVTHLAIGLIEKRMKDAFPGIAFDVVGRPQDLQSALDLATRDKHQFELWALSVVEAQPWKGGRKGADGGIDGIIYFKPDGKKTERAIVEVKGGGTGVKDVGRLAQVMERERAPFGIFITAQMPTSAMIRDAAAVGIWENAHTGRKHPRLQIMTLADLFQGRRPDIPWIDTTVARSAKRESTARQERLL